jgi:hypothetical protein
MTSLDPISDRRVYPSIACRLAAVILVVLTAGIEVVVYLTWVAPSNACIFNAMKHNLGPDACSNPGLITVMMICAIGVLRLAGALWDTKA